MTHRGRQIANENAQRVGRMSASVIRRTAGYAANLVKTILAANPPYLPAPQPWAGRATGAM